MSGESYNTTNIIIIIIPKKHKTGNIVNQQNCEPISLVEQLFKFFIKIITRKQESFWVGYATNLHWKGIKTIIGKCLEYNKSFLLVLVEVKKAFVKFVSEWKITLRHKLLQDRK